MRLRLLTIFAGFLLCGKALHAVQIGDSRETVVAEKGPPTSSIESDSKAILYFQDGAMVTFSLGKVSQISQRPPSQSPGEIQPVQEAVHRSEAGKVLIDALAALRTSKDLCMAIGVGLLTALFLFRVFFSDLSDFGECVRLYFQPDWISMFKNEWIEDKWGTAKLGLWFVLSAAMAFGFYFRAWNAIGH